MKIDLDTVLAAIAPAPVVLTLDRVDYRLREMTLAQAMLLENIGSMESDTATITFLKGLFAESPPPLLDETLTVLIELRRLQDEAVKLRPELLRLKAPPLDAEPQEPPPARPSAEEITRSLTSLSLRIVFGDPLPESLAEFNAAETAMAESRVKLALVVNAISSATAESFPKKAMEAGFKMIRQQIEAQRPSDDSSESS